MTVQSYYQHESTTLIRKGNRALTVYSAHLKRMVHEAPMRTTGARHKPLRSATPSGSYHRQVKKARQSRILFVTFGVIWVIQRPDAHSAAVSNKTSVGESPVDTQMIRSASGTNIKEEFHLESGINLRTYETSPSNVFPSLRAGGFLWKRQPTQIVIGDSSVSQNNP